MERLFYVAAYRCEGCKERVCASYWDRLLAERWVSCMRCGRYELAVRSRRDPIDSMNRNPIRWLQGFLGARLYHCQVCRMQFYDWRGKKPAELAAKRNADNELLGK